MENEVAQDANSACHSPKGPISTEPSDGEDKEHSEDLKDQLSEKDYVPTDFVKSFDGIPDEWHDIVSIRNNTSKRLKLYFRCKYTGC